MNKYAIIDIGGKQLRVEQGRFYDARDFAPIQQMVACNTKISINRVLLICHGSSINFGYPWLNNAAVKGRVLHGCFKKKMVIQRVSSKNKTRRILGYRESMGRFIVDSICFGREKLDKH
uniref:ribosomal protein L21 n=1 Tax=Asplenium castaneoviride TaxID=2601855 RepID=UPI0023AA3B24|nr:ribosomal protein L21 [Asplenium castaneoviride]YP_010702295.1 ribosomal protein L21 [Asplenium ruprechtii]WCL38467.1 ribosomal protein L21 [Asplenium castaneoviride]WCL38555.1 ribosomal protein L21 [Asplenium castaneoviride]WCL38643.1 ribosomal protein L21 [Asplenium ruprechtii]